MINKISCTPFKVNIYLLDFINTDLGSSLLIQESYLSIYEKSEKLSKYKQVKYKSLVSKWILQQLIFKMASLFKKYNYIYFPVKIDNRGRLYCIPPYFNYQ